MVAVYQLRIADTDVGRLDRIARIAFGLWEDAGDKLWVVWFSGCVQGSLFFFFGICNSESAGLLGPQYQCI